MPITNDNPQQVPARDADVLDRLWVREFVAEGADVGGAIRLDAQLVPYSSTTGASDPAGTIAYSADDTFTLGTDDPDADAAVGGVLDQLDAIRGASPNHVLALLELLSQAVGAVAQLPRDDAPLNDA